MAKDKKIKLEFNLNPKNYLKLLWAVYIHPDTFIKQLPRVKSYTFPLQFLILNLSLGYIVAILMERFKTSNPPSIFFALSQLLILVPLFLIIFLILAILFYLVSRLLNGVGSFKETLSYLFLVSLPLIFFGVPFLNIISFFLIFYLVILSFHKIHQYHPILAIINVFLPTLGLLLIAVVLGVIDFRLIQALIPNII